MLHGTSTCIIRFVCYLFVISLQLASYLFVATVTNVKRTCIGNCIFANLPKKIV